MFSPWSKTAGAGPSGFGSARFKYSSTLVLQWLITEGIDG